MDVFKEKKARLCGVCEKSESRYTCPKCNLPYCCLTCYQHESHLGCSEEFYRDCITTQLQAQRAEQGGRGDALLADMLKAELAKRQEDTELFDGDNPGAAEEEEEDGEGEEDDGPSLEERLAAVDLDSADADTILQCLTDAEKKEFESLLDDPRQQAAILTLWTPWWESEEELTLPSKSSCDGCLTMDKFLSLPTLADITKVQPSENLPCDLVNILYAYCSSMRLYNGDLNVDFLLEISSVLADNATFTTVEAGLQSAFAISTQSSASLSLDFCSVLLRDLLRIVGSGKQLVADINSISPPLYALSCMRNGIIAARVAAEESYRECAKADSKRPRLKAHYNSLKRLPEKLYFFLLWAKSSFHDWSMLTESVKIQSEALAQRVAETKESLHVASLAQAQVKKSIVM